MLEEKEVSEAPKPCGYSRQSIEQAGMAFAKHLDVTPDKDLGEIVAAMGGRLEYGDDLPDGGSSRCSIDIPSSYPKEPFVIRLDSFPAPEFDRFGVAHEVGHFVLHYLTQIKLGRERFSLRADFRVETESPEEIVAEIEADWFAYGFLLSEENVHCALAELSNDPHDAVTQLVTRCKVPQIVAFERVSSALRKHEI